MRPHSLQQGANVCLPFVSKTFAILILVWSHDPHRLSWFLTSMWRAISSWSTPYALSWSMLFLGGHDPRVVQGWIRFAIYDGKLLRLIFKIFLGLIVLVHPEFGLVQGWFGPMRLLFLKNVFLWYFHFKLRISPELWKHHNTHNLGHKMIIDKLSYGVESFAHLWPITYRMHPYETEARVSK